MELRKGIAVVSWIHNKDVRSYVAATLFLFLVLLLLAYLTFIPVPPANKDLITAIISMMVGGLGVSLNKLFGKADEEHERMKLEHERELAALRQELNVLKAQYKVLKDAHDETNRRLINAIAFVGDRRFVAHEFADTQPVDGMSAGG